MAGFSNAQYYFHNDKYYSGDLVLEAGGSVGFMNSFTDLGGKKGPGKSFLKDLTLKTAKPSFSVYTLLMYKDAIAFRLEGSFGRVQGYDSILKPSPKEPRYTRNLSFRSKITDLQLAAEIHPLFFKRYDEGEAPYWSPYIVLGVGFFSFNPQASLDGRWYDLQPLSLEGQGFAEYPDRRPYKLHQFNIPVGVGIKYEASTFLNVRLEIVYRILSTDHLDDVSDFYIDPSLFSKYLQANQAMIAKRLYSREQELDPSKIVVPGSIRGDPGKNDAFFTIQLKAGLVIRSRRRD
jgi:hypothetical protein